MGPPKPRSALLVLGAFLNWILALLALLGSLYAFGEAFWGGGLPCMGGGCDPGPEAPTGALGLVWALLLAALCALEVWIGTFLFRSRRRSAEAPQARVGDGDPDTPARR